MQRRHDEKRRNPKPLVPVFGRFVAPVLTFVITLGLFLVISLSLDSGEAIAKQNGGGGGAKQNNGGGGGNQSHDRNPKNDSKQRQPHDSKPGSDKPGPNGSAGPAGKPEKPAAVPEPTGPAEKPGVAGPPAPAKNPTKNPAKPAQKPNPVAEKPGLGGEATPGLDPSKPVVEPNPIAEKPVEPQPGDKPGPVLDGPIEPVDQPGPILGGPPEPSDKPGPAIDAPSGPAGPVEQPDPQSGPVLGEPTEPAEKPGSVSSPARPTEKSAPVAVPAEDPGTSYYGDFVVDERAERFGQELAPTEATDAPVSALDEPASSPITKPTPAGGWEGSGDLAALEPLAPPVSERILAAAGAKDADPLPIAPTYDAIAPADGPLMGPETGPALGMRFQDEGSRENAPPASGASGAVAPSIVSAISPVSWEEGGPASVGGPVREEDQGGLFDDLLDAVLGKIGSLFGHVLPESSPEAFGLPVVGSVADQVPQPLSSPEGGLGSVLFFGSAGSGAFGSGSFASGSAGGGLAILAVLVMLVPASGRLLRVSCDFLRPNSALCPALERPG